MFQRFLQVQLAATWDVCEVRQGSPFKEAVAVINFLDWIAKTLNSIIHMDQEA